jgi:predicted unusual protein kinase regulating ubiquinone biosynthesis (AarF/ABC1/UbiB family)
MAIRPDIVPAPAMKELQQLQDNVKRFPNDVARAVVEEELGPGRTLEDVYSEFSKEPIAAASLAQVYRARLRESGVEVAVKVQRPEALILCSKDMYVLQRAVGVYQGLMQRWTAQRVDYNALLENFASGFYRELDFVNEARNQVAARNAMLESMGGRVYVPKVFEQFTSRRVLVSEFVYGTPLTAAEPEEMRRLLEIGQECFLQQLLDHGRDLHGDPHGGNLLQPDPVATAAAAQAAAAAAEAAAARSVLAGEEIDPVENGVELRSDGEDLTDLLPALGIKPDLYMLDWGLQCTIPDEDKPKLVLAIVHMANRDWAAVTEDFVALGFLPADVDRKKVSPVLAKVLAPYVLGGGGAKAFLGEGVFSASFQDLARDLSLAAVEIPFSIPAYYASATRSIAICEGLALVGDPDYKIVLSSYPWVARKLLQESGDETLRAALNEILYPRSADGRQQPRPNPRRVIALLNNALGRAARTSDLSPAKMLDLDAVPEDAASLTETLAYLGSDKADAIRGILVNEIVVASDLVLRNSTRKLASSLQGAFGIDLPLPSIPFLPRPRIPLPNLFALLPETLRDQALDRVAPALSSEEDVYAGDLGELCKSLLGFDIQDLIVGLASPQKVAALVGPVIMSAMRQPSNSRSSAKYAGFAAQSSPKAGAASETSESLTREFLDLLPFPNVFSRGGSISSAGGSSSGDATRQQARASLEAIGLEVFGQLRKLQEERLGLGSAATEN